MVGQAKLFNWRTETAMSMMFVGDVGESKSRFGWQALEFKRITVGKSWDQCFAALASPLAAGHSAFSQFFGKRDLRALEETSWTVNQILHFTFLNWKSEIRFKKVKRVIGFFGFWPAAASQTAQSAKCWNLCFSVLCCGIAWLQMKLKNTKDLDWNEPKLAQMPASDNLPEKVLTYTCHSHNLDLSMLVPCYFMTIWANWRGLRKCMVQTSCHGVNSNLKLLIQADLGSVDWKFIPHKLHKH